MLARVTTWDGGDAAGLRAAVTDMQAQAATGPPEGVTSRGFTMLVDPDGSHAMMIGLFADQADLDSSEAALKAMSPPPNIGSMVSKNVYEVGVEVRM